MNKWEIDWAWVDSDEADELLARGFEPFAVVGSHLARIWFKRLNPERVAARKRAFDEKLNEAGRGALELS